MAYLDPDGGAVREAAAEMASVELSNLALAIPVAAVADVAGTIPAGGTGAAAGGWDTAGHRDTAITTIGEIKTQLNDLMAKLRTAGILTP